MFDKIKSELSRIFGKDVKASDESELLDLLQDTEAVVTAEQANKTNSNFETRLSELEKNEILSADNLVTSDKIQGFVSEEEVTEMIAEAIEPYKTAKIETDKQLKTLNTHVAKIENKASNDGDDLGDDTQKTPPADKGEGDEVKPVKYKSMAEVIKIKQETVTK